MVKAAGLAFGSVREREKEIQRERQRAKQNAHTLALYLCNSALG